MKYESPRVDFRSGSTAEPGRPWRGDHQRVYMHPVALSRRFCPTVSKSPGVSSNPIRLSPSTAPSPFFRTCRSSVCPASPLENLPCSPGSSIMGASVSERVAAVVRQEEEVLRYILLKRGEPSLLDMPGARRHQRLPFGFIQPLTHPTLRPTTR